MDFVWEQEKLGGRMLIGAQNPQHSVHALLARFRVCLAFIVSRKYDVDAFDSTSENDWREVHEV